jgi:hypothetical protein
MRELSQSVKSYLDREEHLVSEKPTIAKQRLTHRFAQVPIDRSLSDELIEDRREEAKQEEIHP